MALSIAAYMYVKVEYIYPSTTNPKSRANHPTACSGKPTCMSIQQKPEPLRWLALRIRGGRYLHVYIIKNFQAGRAIAVYRGIRKGRGLIWDKNYINC